MWLDLANADYVRDILNFPGCKILLRVDRDLIADDGTVEQSDTRYFLTSLDPDRVTADELLAHVRGHWQIENCQFFVKDRWWDEDRHHTRRPGLSACFAAINNAALSIHRLCSDPALPVRAAADHIAWNPAIGLRLLNS